MTDLQRNREIMVARHLKARGIKDPRVLSAMRSVGREEFVPEGMKENAYQDSPLPIGEGQTISQPYIVAAMIEYLEVTENDRVLEIGTGSGYGAAVLAHVVSEVFTIERNEKLAKAAKKRLARLGFTNVHLFLGDGTLGLPEYAPYDAIIVTAGAPDVPEPLKKQLAIGGFMVLPAGPTPRSQDLMRVHRDGENDYSQETISAVRFVPLIGAAGWQDNEVLQ